MKYRKAVAIDFDGVIHQHVSKWTVPEEIHDPPVPGAFEFIETCLRRYDVVIFSARAGSRPVVLMMEKWFKQHGMKPSILQQLTITAYKPTAFIYIDDRGWRFEGKFPSLEELVLFEPWKYKGEG